MKIYMVSRGQYSDYHIEALYTDKEKADRHAERLNEVDHYACSDVEEVEVRDEAPVFYPVWHVTVRADGEVREESYGYETEVPTHPDVDVYKAKDWDGDWAASRSPNGSWP